MTAYNNWKVGRSGYTNPYEIEATGNTLGIGPGQLWMKQGGTREEAMVAARDFRRSTLATKALLKWRTYGEDALTQYNNFKALGE